MSKQTITGINMRSYEMNQQIVAQLPTLSNKEIEKGKQNILKYVNNTNNSYYLLLCRDLNYYTVFAHNHPNAKPADYIEDVVVECAEYLGDIKAIDKIDNGIEIWISRNSEAIVMYFFAFDQGVELCQ